MVFRFYSTGIETALREAGLLKFLTDFEIKAPRVFDLFEVEGRSVAVMEYLQGEMLQDCLRKPIDLQVFHSVGQELARVHSIQFADAGFIGPGMKIGNEYDSFGEFLKTFILKTLAALTAERLGHSVRDRLVKLVEERWPITKLPASERQLVHCDFNPKNIMIAGDQTIAGILDWEFCLSGNGYIDIGNFFRFSYDYPEGAESLFVDGYESVRGPLQSDWREVSLLLDLGNMCSFLERQEDYQRSFRTARIVIGSTLEYFGY